VLQPASSGAGKVSTDARRQLKALLVTAPEPLRTRLRRGTWAAQAQACAALVAAPTDPVEHRATVRALRLTAERVLGAHQEARQLGKELRTVVQALAPVLLVRPGVGPVTTAPLLISWLHPGRLRSEAAFAMLAGVAPIPGLLRAGGPLPAQPWRGPPAEPGLAHHRDDPRGLARADQALGGPPHRRGQEPP
jgi:transposase